MEEYTMNYTNDEMEILTNIGNIIKGIRKGKGLSQETLGKKVGLSKSSISNIENATNSNGATIYLKVIELIRICKYMDVDLSTIIDFATKEKKQLTEIPSHIIEMLIKKERYVEEYDIQFDSTIHHYRRLEKYFNINITGFCINTERENNNYIKLIIETGELCKSGYVPLTMKVNNHKYKGKLISPPNGLFTHLYLNELSDRAERATLTILHHAGDNKYQGGVGCLFSLARGPQKELCLQKCLLFNNDVLNNQDENSERFLKNLDKYIEFQNGITDSKLYMNCLAKLDDKFYREFVKNNKIKKR